MEKHHLGVRPNQSKTKKCSRRRRNRTGADAAVRVVHFSDPLHITATVSEFKHRVQELTGRQSVVDGMFVEYRAMAPHDDNGGVAWHADRHGCGKNNNRNTAGCLSPSDCISPANSELIDSSSACARSFTTLQRVDRRNPIGLELQYCNPSEMLDCFNFVDNLDAF